MCVYLQTLLLQYVCGTTLCTLVLRPDDRRRAVTTQGSCYLPTGSVWSQTPNHCHCMTSDMTSDMIGQITSLTFISFNYEWSETELLFPELV